MVYWGAAQHPLRAEIKLVVLAALAARERLEVAEQPRVARVVGVPRQVPDRTNRVHRIARRLSVAGAISNWQTASAAERRGWPLVKSFTPARWGRWRQYGAGV